MGRQTPDAFGDSSLDSLTTTILHRCVTGDPKAEGDVIEHFYERLRKFAQDQMGDHLKRRLDPEDAVQSALASFIWRLRDGRFVIENSVSLWRLLVTITLNKIRKAGRKPHELGLGGIDDISGSDASEIDVVALMDEIEKLLSELPKRCGDVSILVLEGYSVSEMAAKLECSRWTIRRALDAIGKRANMLAMLSLRNNDDG